MSNPEIKLAVLIDADNAQPSKSRVLLAEIAKYGTAHVKRAYGDWTGTQLNGWKTHLLQHSIQPIQQFAYTTGKNATDSAMIIDAMDLLHSRQFDGFCIVSSDSDFTRLASRLREAGSLVYGFGRQTTPEAFRVACDRFIYVENIADHENDGTQINTAPQQSNSRVEIKQDSQLAALLRNSVEAVSADGGWAHLSEVGDHLLQKNSDFDPRTYGCSKLSKLVKNIPDLELSMRADADGNLSSMYVRDVA